MAEKNLEIKGDEYRLTTRYDTDEYEAGNYEQLKAAGKGFIRENGELVGRHILRIPVDDAMKLQQEYDLDYMAFMYNNDRAAMKRLVARFPYWLVAKGGV